MSRFSSIYKKSMDISYSLSLNSRTFKGSSWLWSYGFTSTYAIIAYCHRGRRGHDLWWLDLQLPMQSVPITTNVMSSNPGTFGGGGRASRENYGMLGMTCRNSPVFLSSTSALWPGRTVVKLLSIREHHHSVERHWLFNLQKEYGHKLQFVT
jgi:hypothetical protein